MDTLEQKGGKTLLILHNFDELQSGEESGYDDRFFGLLNGIRDRSHASLLCVSEHPHDDWPLQLEQIPLPPLTGEQIAAELRRRNVDESRLSEITDQLLQQHAPYTALDALRREA